MAELALIASIASTALTAAGTIASGNAAKAAGEAQQQAAYSEAKHLEQQGKDALAAGQREMLQERRQKKLALSTLTTRAAAGGFTATDPTALALADEISRYGTYQEQLALYGGEARRSDLDTAATGRRFEGDYAYALGKEQQKGSYIKAASTILGGFSDISSKYRPKGTPKAAGRYG